MSESPVRQLEAVALPRLVVLDVNQTLSDLTPLAAVFTEVGLQSHQTTAWFAAVLRDGIALTLLGDNPAFADLAADGIRRLMRAAHPDRSPDQLDEAADQVIGRFTTLAPHPDVVPGLLALAAAGCRIVTLSNGSAGVARSLLEQTPAGAVIEDYLSVTDAGGWKPAEAAYRYALDHTGVEASDALLVAVHPWDLEGARRAGLRTAWINRDSADYPTPFTAPDLHTPSLTGLAQLFG